MVSKLKWRAFRGWGVKINSAIRCLFYEHYVLVCWKIEEDGDLSFKISHKGVEVSEAVHRLKVDAVEILQDVADQNSAIDQVNNLLK